MPSINLISLAVRVAAGILLIGVVVFASFQWGKNACKAAYEAAQRQIGEDHADNVDGANRNADARGEDGRAMETENEKSIDQIVREAEGFCISDDVIDGLRELQ